MKKLFNINASILVMLMVALQCCFVSCKDSEDDGMGTPVITGVRVCSPDKADSLFTKSAQGQIIAVIGENLSNVVYAYINDQKVYFNPTMNTANNVILTVPTEANGFKLTAFSNELKDEIRLETSHGTATYAFKILGGYPVISRIQCAYPRKAGDILNVYGTNLDDIEDIYFTDITPDSINKTSGDIGGTHISATDYKYIVQDHHLNTKTQAYETTSQMQVVIPDLPYDAGTFVIQCAAGSAYIAFSKTPGQPVITNISSDMPVIGEQITISGREFVQVESVKYGDVTLDPSEYTVAESEDGITFTFNKIPTKGSDPKLSITTPGGTGTYTFYDYAFLLNDMTSYDDGGCPDMNWDPNVEYLNDCPFGGGSRVAHFNTYGQWWGQMLFFSKDWDFNAFTLPSYDEIPANASADDVYIAYEVYDNNSDFNNDGTGYQGFLRVHIWGAANNNTNNSPDVLFHNFQWDNYDAGTFINPYGPILQDIDGEAHKGKWYRAVIRLSDFCLPDADGNPTDPIDQAYKTYSDFVDRGVSVIRFMSYTQGTKTGTVDVYIDNIRLFYKK